MQIIKINDKTYTMPKVKSRMVRKTLEFNEKLNFNNLKTIELDELVDFIVELYGNQFNIDDVYDGLEANELIPTLVENIQAITQKTADKLDKFPKNE